MAAFEWIAQNAQHPAVVSMSVAGDLSVPVNEAAARLVQAFGIPMVVAAGGPPASAIRLQGPAWECRMPGGVLAAAPDATVPAR